MSDDIDLNYRPDTYFRPKKLEHYLLSKVKGAALRKTLQSLFDAGRHAEVRDLLTAGGLSADDRKALESWHPMFLGGNYLPDTRQGEVEIARINIKSTTSDVTCVYARPKEGVIHFRVVDEYDGDTLDGPSEAKTTQPMTLGEFADFFLQAWPLMNVLEMNFEGDLDGALGFFSADSKFYPEFDRLCRQRVTEHYPEDDDDKDEDEWEAGDHCPFCGHFNSTPADDTCEHICAWVWDGHVEILRQGVPLESALKDLAALVEPGKQDSGGVHILQKESQSGKSRAALIDAASGNCGLVEALTGLAKAELGEGWSTKGMLGGSGYNVYVPSPQQLDSLTTECIALIETCAMKSPPGDDETKTTSNLE